MTKKDWTLLAIGLANEPVSPVQLQKVLFLLGEYARKAVGRKFYKFQPYNYGPFSLEVYNDVEELIREGSVESIASSGGWREFVLSGAGLERLSELQEEAPSDTVVYLGTLIQWAQSLSFQELVRTIYKYYPKYRAKSVFRDSEVR